MDTQRRLALVTGASAGIGRDMARILAARGWDLLVTARNGPALEGLSDELSRDQGVQVHVAVRDLSQPAGVDGLLADLAALERPLDLLINNAGFGLHGPYLDTDPEAELAMLGVNIEALVRLTHALLPAMVERGRGIVLNVGSTAGFLPGPLMTTYYATKAFVLSYTDALAHEVDGTGVTLTCLCPGPTRTGFQHRAGARGHGALRAGAMDSLPVARAGIDGALQGRRRVVPGWFNRASTWLPRVLPRDLMTSVVARIQEGRR